MRTRVLPLLAATLLGLATAHADDAGSRIDRLIGQLGSPRFTEREAATKELDALGPAALPALKKATASTEPETRRRAEALIARIENRQQAEKILKATSVRLVCKETPVPDAVADLAKQSGLALKLQGDAAKLRARTVTLDTGATTFWQALDQLCRAANLVEVLEIEVPFHVEQAPRLRRGAVQPLPPRLVPVEPGQVLLKDGTPTDRPVHYAGAARIRLVGTETPIMGSPRGEGELLFALEASLEPRVHLDHTTGTRIEKAVDDQGQELKQTLPSDPAAPFGEPIFIANHNGLARALLGTGAQQVAVRLQAGAKPAKSLREVKGWVTAEVRTPPEPVLEVADILDAAGKAVKGPQGACVTVTEVENLDQGALSIRVDLVPATKNLNNLFNAVRRPVGDVHIPQGGGAVIGPPGGVLADPMGLSLVDDKGKSFQLIGVPRRRFVIDQNVVTHDLTLHFKPVEGQGKPAKLLYSTMRVLTLEIPFALKDVPLR